MFLTLVWRPGGDRKDAIYLHISPPGQYSLYYWTVAVPMTTEFVPWYALIARADETRLWRALRRFGDWCRTPPEPSEEEGSGYYSQEAVLLHETQWRRRGALMYATMLVPTCEEEGAVHLHIHRPGRYTVQDWRPVREHEAVETMLFDERQEPRLWRALRRVAEWRGRTAQFYDEAEELRDA